MPSNDSSLRLAINIIYVPWPSTIWFIACLLITILHVLSNWLILFKTFEESPSLSLTDVVDGGNSWVWKHHKKMEKWEKKKKKRATSRNFGLTLEWKFCRNRYSRIISRTFITDRIVISFWRITIYKQFASIQTLFTFPLLTVKHK